MLFNAAGVDPGSFVHKAKALKLEGSWCVKSSIKLTQKWVGVFSTGAGALAFCTSHFYMTYEMN